MRFIIAIALTALALLPAQAAEPIVKVPYRVDYSGWFTVPVTVNGQGPYDFIIDTGATQSLVFENLANIQEFAPTGGAPQTVLGLASQGAFPTYAVGDVAIGPARLTGLVTVILGDWTYRERSPQGVLGLDFIERFDLVFDARAGELRLYAAGEAPAAETANWKSARLEADDFGLDAGRLYTVSGRLEGRRLNFLVDLGASGTIINNRAFNAVMSQRTRVRMAPSALGSRLTDALDETESIRMLRVGRFQVGGARWSDKVIFVHDAAIFGELGRQRDPFGLFGADMLYGRSFALKFAEGRLFIGPDRG